ncbi:hypothetical protein [Candidatus Nitrosocosmicus franklandus]|uniref:hypothetical protein n=1 Tax=Candidatus Nitrosocosmicus franklandianus TaxID=1798806 RepID=UPI0011AE222E|nr:hypothetical protein [Candidatus Nitrosocosmicus franklandus]
MQKNKFSSGFLISRYLGNLEVHLLHNHLVLAKDKVSEIVVWVAVVVVVPTTEIVYRNNNYVTIVVAEKTKKISLSIRILFY